MPRNSKDAFLLHSLSAMKVSDLPLGHISELPDLHAEKKGQEIFNDLSHLIMLRLLTVSIEPHVKTR